MTGILFKEEVYNVIGFCMNVWKTLGYGFSEVIYKDAMEIEFLENNITHVREDELFIYYKGKILKHRFRADFTVFDKIIIEVKSGEEGVISNTIQQILNYMKASGCRVGLIINFGKKGIEYKRLII
jgi:GxxExxY protein